MPTVAAQVWVLAVHSQYPMRGAPCLAYAGGERGAYIHVMPSCTNIHVMPSCTNACL